MAVYHLRARSRAVVFGALFFLVTALPILQIVLIGTAAVTERYTYLPALGIYFVAAVGLRHLFLVTFARNQVARVCLAAGAGAAILALCSLTHARCGVWRDSLSLWNDVIAKHPSALAYNNRGIYHAQHHDLARAVDDLEHALRLRPTYALAYFNRANVYRNLGDLDRSLADNSLAIRWCPTYVLAYYHRGVTYCLKGDYDHGIADLSQTIALNPNHAGALLNRGLAYERQNDRERAAQDFARACALGESTACQILSHG